MAHEIYVSCQDCGVMFTITLDQLEVLKSKGFDTFGQTCRDDGATDSLLVNATPDEDLEGKM